MRNDIIFGAVLPYLAFLAAQRLGFTDVHALAIGSVFPLGMILFSFLHSRRIAAISIVTLTATLASLIASLWFNSTYLALLKNSLITGCIGLVFLGSLAAPRPLVFFLASEGDDQKRTEAETYWQNSQGYRLVMREMTLAWACALLMEAGLRAVIIPLLPIDIFLPISEAMWIVVFAGMMAWSMRFGSRRMKSIKAEAGAPDQDAGHAAAHP